MHCPIPKRTREVILVRALHALSVSLNIQISIKFSYTYQVHFVCRKYYQQDFDTTLAFCNHERRQRNEVIFFSCIYWFYICIGGHDLVWIILALRTFFSNYVFVIKVKLAASSPIMHILGHAVSDVFLSD